MVMKRYESLRVRGVLARFQFRRYKSRVLEIVFDSNLICYILSLTNQMISFTLRVNSCATLRLRKYSRPLGEIRYIMSDHSQGVK